MTGRQPRKRKKSEVLESPIQFERGLGLQGTGARPYNIFLDNEAVMDGEDDSSYYIPVIVVALLVAIFALNR